MSSIVKYFISPFKLGEEQNLQDFVIAALRPESS